MRTPRESISCREARPQKVRIAPPTREDRRGWHRVQCLVDGESLWFESPDVTLRASLEAFGSALLLAAAASGRRLEFAASPDAVWLRNTEQALAIAADWWGYPRLTPMVSNEPSPDGSSREPRGSVLCFSGGVDSFYTLLRGRHRVDHLVFVHGFDMNLADVARAAAAEATLRCVAAERGINSVLIRSNLRVHPAARAANWEHTHGGALAAVGHLLVDRVDQLLISSSYPRVFDHPWGSHWTLDPCWASSCLSIEHVGAEKWRAEKLAAMLDEPLVRRHLRVCWENHSPSGNCGRCEKCLRTMLVLDGHGRLADFPVFPTAATLGKNLRRLATLRPDLMEIYGSFLKMDLSADVRRAVEALIERSRRVVPPPAPESWWRGLRRA